MDIKDFQKSNEYLVNAREKESKSDLIKYISVETWNRIGFVKEFGDKYDKIFEVTITQNIMFEISKFMLINGLNIIDIYESKNESLYGNDLLLCIEINKKYVKIPIQAKIINFKNKEEVYASIFHENKNGAQIDLLENYSNNVVKSKVALYLFYNYSNNFSDENKSLYGCSYIDTESLREVMKGKNKIKFDDLHPGIAKPFYRLFEQDGDCEGGVDSSQGPDDNGGGYPDGNKLQKLYERLGKVIPADKIKEVELYEKSDITTDEWIKTSLAILEQDLKQIPKDVPVETSKGADSFEPKYMIVLCCSDNLTSDLGGTETFIPGEAEDTEIDFIEKEIADEKRVSGVYELEGA